MSIVKSVLLFGLQRKYCGFGYATSKLYKQGIIASNKFGVKFSLDPYDAIEGSILMDGYFDEPVLHALVGQLKEGDTFWDVGSNIGLHSLTIKKLKPSINCYCFEPYYLNFARLVKNSLLNPALEIIKYNFGLAVEHSVEGIHTTLNNHGRSSLNAMTNSQPTNVNVATLPGDFLLQKGVPLPNVMKIDTEGFEFSVLKGCIKLLESNELRAIVYEAFTDQSTISSFLTNFGFKVSRIDQIDNFLAVRT
jgi:FkbM family methyltransferase